jgi:predicted DNA-binding transcriptional regulator AlpA
MIGQMADNQKVLPPSRICLISDIEERMAELRITTHKQLAELAGYHESTISRLMSENEYMPRRLMVPTRRHNYFCTFCQHSC